MLSNEAGEVTRCDSVDTLSSDVVMSAPAAQCW